MKSTEPLLDEELEQQRQASIESSLLAKDKQARQAKAWASMAPPGYSRSGQGDNAHRQREANMAKAKKSAGISGIKKEKAVKQKKESGPTKKSMVIEGHGKGMSVKEIAEYAKTTENSVRWYLSKEGLKASRK